MPQSHVYKTYILSFTQPFQTTMTSSSASFAVTRNGSMILFMSLLFKFIRLIYNLLFLISSEHRFNLFRPVFQSITVIMLIVTPAQSITLHGAKLHPFSLTACLSIHFTPLNSFSLGPKLSDPIPISAASFTPFYLTCLQLSRLFRLILENASAIHTFPLPLPSYITRPFSLQSLAPFHLSSSFLFHPIHKPTSSSIFLSHIPSYSSRCPHPSFLCPGPTRTSTSSLQFYFYSVPHILLLRSSDDGDFLSTQNTADPQVPTDISLIPDTLAADPDDTLPQSDVLKELTGTAVDPSSFAKFNSMRVHTLKLSKLKTFYDKKDKNVLSLLSKRHSIVIDDEFRLKMGAGQIRMNTKSSMIDYHLTVANCIGFSPLLPNAQSHHLFEFKMDLKKQIREFKGKHAMLGFDPAGRMLFIGTRDNEDVFLAMAPSEFLQGEIKASHHGRPTSSPVMSRRHYRQTVMMIAHFLADLPEHSYLNHTDGVFVQDLESEHANFHLSTDALYVPFSHLSTLYLVNISICTFNIQFPRDIKIDKAYRA
jgi:hypothetical protein